MGIPIVADPEHFCNCCQHALSRRLVSASSREVVQTDLIRWCADFSLLQTLMLRSAIKLNSTGPNRQPGSQLLLLAAPKLGD